MISLYTILEITKTASQSDIKASYRRLVKIYHPDSATATSEEKVRHFQRIQSAYEILSNPEQRHLYDNGEISHTGNPTKKKGFKYQSKNNPDFSMDDLFSFLHKKASEKKKEPPKKNDQPLSYSIKIPFVDACRGTNKTLNIKGEPFTLSIPPGVANKSSLEVPWKDEKIFIQIYVAPHAHLKRQGSDILLDAPITLSEALCGNTITVPTIHGPASLIIPSGIDHGEVLTLKNQGIPGSQPGDQHIKILIALPVNPDQSLKEVLKSWEKSNPYNPRNFF